MIKRIADTHIHVWDLDQAEYLWLKGNTSILNRSWSIEELETERVAAGITAGVLVQAANNFEDTDWMLEVAESTDWISGVVGWLPLTDPSATQEALEKKYGKHNYFKGVRHLIHNEPDPQWLSQPAVVSSLEILAARGIPYDVVGVMPAHIEAALEVAEKIPALRMVFDHLSQPPVAAKEKFGKWGELMMAAAQHKNFYAKISGLGTASGNFESWEAKDIKPYIEFVLQHFGADRCFCGGDWPVSILAGSYTKTWNAYQEIIRDLTTGNDRDKIFYTNAGRFYSL
jgi:L-fuconolactonase